MNIYIVSGVWMNHNWYIKVKNHGRDNVLLTPNGYKRMSDIMRLVNKLKKAWPNAVVYQNQHGRSRFYKLKDMK